MSASEAFTEPSLFDHTSREHTSKSPPIPPVVERDAGVAAATQAAEPEAASGSTDLAALGGESPEAPEAALSPEAIAQNERKRLAEQLDALKRKEFELRRADRLATFERERQSALEQLMIAMATHDAALNAAGLEPSNLVPEIAGWLPDLEALAKKVSVVQVSA
jgi:hypothetical protein